MLRTSLRIHVEQAAHLPFRLFLSSNAQDFIEESVNTKSTEPYNQKFLSSNAQDFIEEARSPAARSKAGHS